MQSQKMDGLVLMPLNRFVCAREVNWKGALLHQVEQS